MGRHQLRVKRSKCCWEGSEVRLLGRRPLERGDQRGDVGPGSAEHGRGGVMIWAPCSLVQDLLCKLERVQCLTAEAAGPRQLERPGQSSNLHVLPGESFRGRRFAASWTSEGIQLYL